MITLRIPLLSLALSVGALYAQNNAIEQPSSFAIPPVPTVQSIPSASSTAKTTPTATASAANTTQAKTAATGNNKSTIKPVNTNVPLGAGTQLQGGPQATGEECQLVAINDAARQNMQDMMTGVVDILFNDPDFRAGLEASAKTGGKCVADITKIWQNLSGNFAIGGNLSSILDKFKNFKPMDLLSDLMDYAIEEACQMAKREVMGMFGKVNDLLSQHISLGPLGGISTNALIRYDGSATFNVNAHGPSTSSITSYLDNLWK